MAALGIAAVLATDASGEAGDPFAASVPSYETAAPKATPAKGKTHSVSEKMGTASYGISVEMPPNRQGMVPSLGLSYSSSGGARSEIAVGWSLGLPTIERDPSAGANKVVYKMGSEKLIPVADVALFGGTTYRKQFDDGRERIEYLGSGGWVVQSPSGRTQFYASHWKSSESRTIWNLTSESDSWGNTINYKWRKMYPAGGIAYVLSEIEYGANANAGLIHHAKVTLNWALDKCSSGAIRGISLDRHFGRTLVRGAMRLSNILTSVRGRPVRRMAISYDAADCNATDKAPLRYLSSVQETGYSHGGSVDVAPAMTFSYGPKKTLHETGTTNLAALQNLGYLNQGHTVSGQQSKLMDVNGDGIGDWATAELDAVDHQCYLSVRLGQYGGGYADSPFRTPLPTIAWRKGRWQDGFAPEAGEICTINGQKAYSPVTGDTTPGACSVTGGGNTASYHWVDYDSDGRTDLLVNVWTDGYYDPRLSLGDNDYGALGFLFAPEVSSEPGDVGNPCPSTLTTQSAEYVAGALPNGPYRWRVYRSSAETNGSVSFQGIGDPSDPDFWLKGPQYITSPRPMPIAVGGETAGPNNASTSLQTLIDIDGDGHLDVTATGSSAVGFSSEGFHRFADSTHVWIWFGNDAGQFADTPQGWKFGSPNIKLATNGWGNLNRQDKYIGGVATALRDMNGDGLPDLVVNIRDNTDTSALGDLHVYWNLGKKFSSMKSLGLEGPIEQSRTDVQRWAANHMLGDGQRGNLRTFMDVDGDGLPDRVVFYPNASSLESMSQSRVQFNTGAGFAAATALPFVWKKAQRLFLADDQQWHVATELADANGDGLPDLISYRDGSRTLHIESHPVSQGPPRSLRTVENGQGMVVRFEYAPSTDGAVVRDARIPQVKWVVKAVHVNAGFGQPVMTTAYRYEKPAYGSPTNGRDYQFLGFERVTTRSASPDGGVTRGGKTERVYRYELDRVDYRGQLVEQLIYLDQNDDASLLSHKTFGWRAERLFLGAVIFTHGTETKTRTCVPGAPNCRGPQPAGYDNVLREQQVWSPWWPSSGGVLGSHRPPATMYLQRQTIIGSGEVAGAGDRRTQVQYQVRYGQSPFGAKDYRILTERTESQQDTRDGTFGVVRVTGRTATVYNNATGLPEKTIAYVDSYTRAVTLRTFDGKTGNLLTRKKPQQVASTNSATQARESYTYDAQRVQVVSTTNERNHVVNSTYDDGTGLVLETEGPNSRMIWIPGCVPSSWSNWRDCAPIVWDSQSWTYDGFGRETQHRRAVDAGDAGYKVRLVGRTRYTDANVSGGVGVTVFVEKRQDFGGWRWIKTASELDGIGRVLKTTEYRQLYGQADAVTRYDYDPAGNLKTIHKPDPTVDSGATVPYKYRYDGSGRLVLFTPPGGEFGMVEVSYAGTQKTVRDLTSDQSGGATTGVYDAFGRLIEIREENDAPLLASVTLYSYDAKGRLEGIQDADENITTMTHDWAGNRLSITRGNRTWAYSYDLNNNVKTELPPRPSGAAASAYTTSYDYDHLDRVKSKQIAKKGFTPSQLTELGMGDFTYSYDQGTNGKGRLYRVTSAAGSTTYTYQAQGLVATKKRSFTVQPPLVASKVTVTQKAAFRYNATGQRTHTSYDGGTNGKNWKTEYDARNQVQRVRWYDASASAWRNVADYGRRSVAGLPRARNTSYSQRRSWLYDVTGRIRNEWVMRTSTADVPTMRTYEFTQAGNVASSAISMGSASHDFLYRYDARDRLIQADSPSYHGAFGYTGAGNVTDADVGGGDIAARNVDYHYGNRDPQAVDLLTNSNGSSYAAFLYDPAGNTVERTVGGANTVYDWDAEDQMRRATDDAGVAETYYYDHTGSRFLAIHPTRGIRFWFGGSETHYLRTGQEKKRWMHLSDASGALARVEIINGDASIELQYGDMLRNLMVSLDATGATVASFVYGPFGQVIAKTGADTHTRRFNGKEDDKHTGLRYYGARYYDPITLRWTAGDPLYRFAPEVGLTTPSKHNLYHFSENNPLRFYDPDGRDSIQQMAFRAAVRVAVLAKKKDKEAGEAVGQVVFDRTVIGEGMRDYADAKYGRKGTGVNPELKAGFDMLMILSVRPKKMKLKTPQFGIPKTVAKPEIKRGPNGAKKHTPGHNTKSGPQKTKRHQKRAAQKRQAAEARKKAAQQVWAKMSETARRLRPELHPARIK